ncbi:hypothetical protein SAMN05421839_1335 [Halolactibacillus halophilus]|uniref:Uncharacterized protein n=1 Tax=Halolactibacillus halophilus TaxID=306540 RepID=A0A1I5RPW8_9BACI|nr:hypothetical protein SAMN05421839_1335 [Halolactibacillus halophilus]
MKTIADVLREEGKEEGIAETLLTLLGRKLGQLPQDTQT